MRRVGLGDDQRDRVDERPWGATDWGKGKHVRHDVVRIESGTGVRQDDDVDAVVPGILAFLA